MEKMKVAFDGHHEELKLKTERVLTNNEMLENALIETMQDAESQANFFE